MAPGPAPGWAPPRAALLTWQLVQRRRRRRPRRARPTATRAPPQAARRGLPRCLHRRRQLLRRRRRRALRRRARSARRQARRSPGGGAARRSVRPRSMAGRKSKERRASSSSAREKMRAAMHRTVFAGGGLAIRCGGAGDAAWPRTSGFARRQQRHSHPASSRSRGGRLRQPRLPRRRAQPACVGGGGRAVRAAQAAMQRRAGAHAALRPGAGAAWLVWAQSNGTRPFWCCPRGAAAAGPDGRAAVSAESSTDPVTQSLSPSLRRQRR